MAAETGPGSAGRSEVDRSDIEAKVREIEATLSGGVERAKPRLLASGILITLLVIAIAYLFGKRIGTKRSAIVEVRRV